MKFLFSLVLIAICGAALAETPRQIGETIQPLAPAANAERREGGLHRLPDGGALK